MSDKIPAVRVAACLPLELKTVSPADIERRRAAVYAGPQIREHPPAQSSFRAERQDILNQIVGRLEALESKIDALATLMLRDQQREAREQAISMELSGDGLVIYWPTPLPVGQVVELDLTLALFPPAEISFLAEVIRCDPDSASGGHEVEVRFVTISETSRDEIHRFILTSQRHQRRTAQVEAVRRKASDSS